MALSAAPASGRLSLPPHGVVAASGKTGAVPTQKASGDSRDGRGAPVWSALLVGGLVGALVLIGLAVLPAAATPRFARRRFDRLDILIAGVLAQLAVTLVYFATALF
jgi:hypothetical protein